MEKHLNKRQLQHNQTLDNIRKAVDNLAYRVSLESITVRDICKEAGITVGTFYYYFSSKTELLIDRHTRTNEYFEEFGLRVLAKLKPEEAVKALTIEFMNYLYSRVFSIMLEYTKAMVENKDDTFSHSSIKKWAEIIIAEGQSSGVFRTDLQMEVLSEFYFMQIHGLVVNYCISKGNRTLENPVNELLIQSILSGLMAALENKNK